MKIEFGEIELFHSPLKFIVNQYWFELYMNCELDICYKLKSLKMGIWIGILLFELNRLSCNECKLEIYPGEILKLSWLTWNWNTIASEIETFKGTILIPTIVF